MKIILITNSPDLHSSRHIAKAAQALQIDCLCITTKEVLKTPKHQLSDAIIINRNSGIDYLDNDLDYLCAVKDSIISNTLENAKIFRDKWTQYEQFIAHGINTIPTINLESFTQERLNSLRKEYPTHDFLIKPKRSHQTKGIIKTDNPKAEIEKLIERKDCRYILQPLLAKRKEYRVLICAEETIGILIKNHDDPYALLNCASASLEMLQVSKSPKRLLELIEKTKIFKLDFYALDILEDANGRIRLIELNNMPGFELFEKVTKIDVGHQLISSLVKKFISN